MSALAHRALEQLTGHDAAGAMITLATPTEAAEFAVLGMLHLQAEAWAEALAALRRARELGDGSAVTQLNLALAEDRLGLDGRARMRALMRFCPDWDEPPVRLAESLRRADEPVLAAAEYERALDINPNRTDALLGLGVLSILGGDPERAQILLLRCCGIQPRRAEAWEALGIALLATEDSAAAESAFAEARRLAPDDIGIALRLVEAAFAAGSATAELARLEVATERDPLDVAQLTARAILLDRLGRGEEAVDLLETAVLLAPDAPLPAAALANALLHTAQFAAAVPALKRATELSPDNLGLRNDHAAALNRVHRYREGREILESLIAEFGEQPALLCNLANSLISLGLQAAGVAAARRATEVAPEQSLGWRTLSSALTYCDGVAAAEILAAARQAASLLPRDGAPPPTRPEASGRRLRLGLLSPNLRTHPVGWLTLAAFEALDPAAFELICLGQARSDDAVCRRFQAIAAEWHVITGRPAAAVATCIREAGIDILIDMGGWGDQGTLAVCALRPAPVQVKWVGMQNHSSGVAEMDWFISDQRETPEGADTLYCERLLRLPDGYVCYSAPPYAPEVAALPADARGAVTFGCFNNLAKITPPTIAAWARVLTRVPGSRLVLKTHQFNDRTTAAWMRESFAVHGVDPSRIETRGSSSHRAQLAQHADIDIVLDPFPYSGGLTTCEALWMGVPVVTMPGESFASRHSASHLGNAGLGDWVAADIAGYVDLAVARAADLPALRRLRAGLRPMMKASPLCDAPRFAANLGAALRQVWQARPAA